MSASLAYVDAPQFTELAHVEHWSPEAATARLRRLLATTDLPVDVPSSARNCSGESNDVWDLGDSYLRVCWRGDRDRLLREAELLRALPTTVPHAPVVAVGHSDEMSWLVTERVLGTSLSELVETDPLPSQREVFRDVARVLETFHNWSPPATLRTRLTERPTMNLADPLTIWAADLVALQLDRLAPQVEMARSLPFVDGGLLDDVAERIEQLTRADLFSRDPSVGVVVHGDAFVQNWLVRDGHITALLDFEWARIAPRDLDLLLPIILSQPNDGSGDGTVTAPYLRWLEEDYPQLFAAPDFDDRLWLYELSFCVHQLTWWPPAARESSMVSWHPLPMLRRLVDAPLAR
jgi:aminoglycoside phosphotransferase (APT) family kinase protein